MLGFQRVVAQASDPLRAPASRRPASGAQNNPYWARLATRAQPKLEVGPANDPLEREADQVADAVMRTSNGPSPITTNTRGSGTLQRQCQTCEDEVLQRKPIERSKAPVGGDALAARLARLGSGQPLAQPERDFFEPRFGRDFGALRIHADPYARALAQSVGARAFTLGTDIVLGPGETVSGGAGRRLLAHELTHVLQQSGGGSMPAASRNPVSAAPPKIQRTACSLPCPASKPSSLPTGFIEYYGGPGWFHCGFWGMKEDCSPTPEHPQNECFYDGMRRLVDETHEFSGCRGTPNAYDSEDDSFLHTVWDDGGIVWAGLPAFLESRHHDVDEVVDDVSHAVHRALDWREWLRLAY